MDIMAITLANFQLLSTFFYRNAVEALAQHSDAQIKQVSYLKCPI